MKGAKFCSKLACGTSFLADKTMSTLPGLPGLVDYIQRRPITPLCPFYIISKSPFVIIKGRESLTRFLVIPKLARQPLCAASSSSFRSSSSFLGPGIHRPHDTSHANSSANRHNKQQTALAFSMGSPLTRGSCVSSCMCAIVPHF